MNNSKLEINKDKELIYAYLAGIIDGEGYIGIRKKNSRCLNRISINMTNPEAIKLLCKVLGLKYQKRSPNSSNVNANLPMYVCYVEHKKTTGILRCLYPYLRVKKEQARLMLSLNKNMPLKEQQILRNKIKLLNRPTKLPVEYVEKTNIKKIVKLTTYIN